MRPASILAAALAFGLPVAGTARAAAPRPKVGLVLSGGSAHGFAHIGVLKVLEELRVPVDVVAGTSMGAVVGGFYASGISPAEMERLVLTTDWEDLLDDRPSRATLSYRRKQDDRLNFLDLEMGISRKGITFPAGLIAGQKLSFLLKSETLHTVGVPRFDDLPIPFRCVATDLATGEEVVLSDGSLAEAIRASMSLPAAFPPVERGARLLVDGGLVDNLPVDQAEAMGATAVIAVDVTSDRSDLERLRSFGGVLGRVIDLPIRRNVAASLPRASVVVAPEVDDFPSMDFSRGAELIARGEAAARAAAPLLAAYSLPEDEYRAWRARVRDHRAGSPVVDAIQVASRGIDTRQVLARLETKTGRPLDVEELKRDLDRIWEMGVFETVEFQVVKDGARNVLIVDARPKSSGRTFLRVGSGFESNFQGDATVAVRAMVHAMQLDALGAELRVTLEAGSVPGANAELYQPLDFAGRLFASVEAGYSRSIARVSVAGGPSGEGRLSMFHSLAEAGVNLGSFGQLRLGALRATGRGEPILAQGVSGTVDVELGGYHAFAGVDTLDDLNFPRKGALLTADLDLFRRTFGTSVSGERLQLRAVAAVPFGRKTSAVLNAGWADRLGGDLPFYLLFTLADFTRMAALAREVEAGERAAYASLTVSRRVGKLPTRLGRGIYAGATFELGRVWERREDAALTNLRPAGGVFAGADTVLGPIYAGLGFGYGGTNTLYLFLGRPF